MAKAGSKYGSEHRRRRAAVLARFRPGQPCTRCGQPIASAEDVQLGHPEPGNGMTYGAEHQRCNLSAGGQKGQALRAARAGTEPLSLTRCAHCGHEFMPKRRGQESCSRPCAVAVRRGDPPLPPSGRPW